MSVSFELLGREQIERKLTPDLYLPSVSTLLRDASDFAAREAVSGAVRDAGAVARSIVVETKSPMEMRIVAKHPGALAAEFGRKAGSPPPPTKALEAWAAGHGMSGFEFVLARAIGRRGIKGRFFMRAARDKLRHTELPRLVRRAADEIERKWAAR